MFAVKAIQAYLALLKLTVPEWGKKILAWRFEVGWNVIISSKVLVTFFFLKHIYTIFRMILYVS